ncbi:MAG: outer membrane protein assembly factor [Opitutales bacterium]
MKKPEYHALLAVLLFACACAASAQSNIEVSGMGFLKDRNLNKRLSFLLDVNPSEEITLDAAVLEDSAFLLMEQVKRNGYLQPTIIGKFKMDGDREKVSWEDNYSIQLDAGFTADHAEFTIKKGVFYYYDSISVEGVSALEEGQAERYFIPGGALFTRKKDLIFTPMNFERRLGRLLRALDENGYRKAREANRTVEMDETTGGVDMDLVLEEGPLHRVGDLSIEINDNSGTIEERSEENVGAVLTPDWERELRRSLRNESFSAGYPDTRISIETLAENTKRQKGHEEAVLIRDLHVRVERGEPVRLTGVRFEGDPDTRRSLLRRQADLNTDEPLDLFKASEGRRKLMGLGIYSDVDMNFEPPEGPEREVVYKLDPDVRKELNTLLGWGSYEQLRAGFEWNHSNPWGLAHRYEIGAKQSFKATRVDAGYFFPQVLGSEATAYVNAEYNVREELSFDRENRSVSVGTGIPVGPSGLRLTTEYGISREITRRESGGAFVSEERARVASLLLRATLDRRDSFRAPTSGYSLFASYKVANAMLGGSVNFQKLETGASHHFSVTDSLIAHSSLRLGTIYTSESAEKNIPFNERFFPGGENTVRGYLRGEASPLDINGDEIGAETSVIGNFELEQRVLNNFSIVGFMDAVGISRDGFFEDETDVLYSVGLGLRYQSIVGPIRLEYGHNLSPREEDPEGRLHFSIGFPF